MSKKKLAALVATLSMVATTVAETLVLGSTLLTTIAKLFV